MFTDTINENELKMNIIKNNIEMHFDKFNLRSFWSRIWQVIPVQTRTIRRGALRFAPQISPLLNFYLFPSVGLPKFDSSQSSVDRSLLSANALTIDIILQVVEKENYRPSQLKYMLPFICYLLGILAKSLL